MKRIVEMINNLLSTSDIVFVYSTEPRFVAGLDDSRIPYNNIDKREWEMGSNVDRYILLHHILKK